MVVGHAHALGELGVRAKVHGLPVDGHEVLGVDHGQHELELLLAAVAGDVDRGVRLVIDVATDLRERVNDALDALLVAGDGRRRDDDRIALAD